MNRRSIPTLFLFFFALCLTNAAPVFADELLDVIEAAQITILNKYPNKDSLARKIALEELEKIARSGETDDEIIEALLEKFPETSEELFARSDRNSNGVPDEWEKKSGISTAVPGSDEDADGFTLLQEYKAGTDPVNPLSHPKYITRIYVSAISRKRLAGLELASVDSMGKTGWIPDKRAWTVSFNVIRNGRKRAEFVGINSTFKSDDETFRVTDIEIDGKTQDPVVYLQRVGKTERIPCRLKRPVYEPGLQVRFLNSLNGRTFVSRVGVTFRLGSKKTGEEVYKVVSMDPDTKTAVVESVGEAPETFKILPVPKDIPVAKPAVKPAQAKNAAPAKRTAENPAKPAEKAPMNLSVYAKSAEVNFFTRQPASVRNAAPGGTVPASTAAKPSSVPATPAASSKAPAKSAASAANQRGTQTPARASQTSSRGRSASK